MEECDFSKFKNRKDYEVLTINRQKVSGSQSAFRQRILCYAIINLDN